MSDNSNMDDFLDNLRERRRNELAELRILNQSGVSRLINANPNLVTEERAVPSGNTNSSDLDEELRDLMQSQRVSGLLNNIRFRETLQARLNSSLQSLAESQASSVSRSSDRTAPIPSAAPAAPVTSQPMSQVTVEDVLDPQNDPEISALVNYQVVSSILQSAFRSHLESTIWSRYVSRQTGINLAQEDGQQTNNATTGTAFNPPRPTNIRSTQPMTSMGMSNSNMLQNMQQEITDIRSMITILVQSQIESQRFIRSEVSQLFNRLNNAENIQFGITRTPVEPSNPCCICLETESDTMVYRCGHVCLCYPCSVSLRINQTSNRAANSSPNATPINCPVCRSPAQDIVRVFSASQHQPDQSTSDDLQQPQNPGQ